MSEERLARIEVNVAHLQADVAELKADVREIRKDITGIRSEIADVRVEIADFKVEVAKEFGSVRASIEQVNGTLRTMIVQSKVWMMGTVATFLLAVATIVLRALKLF